MNKLKINDVDTELKEALEARSAVNKQSEDQAEKRSKKWKGKKREVVPITQGGVSCSIDPEEPLQEETRNSLIAVGLMADAAAIERKMEDLAQAQQVLEIKATEQGLNLSDLVLEAQGVPPNINKRKLVETVSSVIGLPAANRGQTYRGNRQDYVEKDGKLIPYTNAIPPNRSKKSTKTSQGRGVKKQKLIQTSPQPRTEVHVEKVTLNSTECSTGNTNQPAPASSSGQSAGVPAAKPADKSEYSIRAPHDGWYEPFGLDKTVGVQYKGMNFVDYSDLATKDEESGRAPPGGPSFPGWDGSWGPPPSPVPPLDISSTPVMQKRLEKATLGLPHLIKWNDPLFEVSATVGDSLCAIFSILGAVTKTVLAFYLPQEWYYELLLFLLSFVLGSILGLAVKLILHKYSYVFFDCEHQYKFVQCETTRTAYDQRHDTHHRSDMLHLDPQISNYTYSSCIVFKPLRHLVRFSNVIKHDIRISAALLTQVCTLNQHALRLTREAVMERIESACRSTASVNVPCEDWLMFENTSIPQNTAVVAYGLYRHRMESLQLLPFPRSQQ